MSNPLCKIARETGTDVPLQCLFGCSRNCAEEDEAGLRVIIAGSRSVTQYEYVRHAMQVFRENCGQGPFVRVVSGCARGVDKLGERWARENGVTVKHFEVSSLEWVAAPRTAGHRRNGRMAEYATHLVAIWDGKSGGTADMVRKAKLRGLCVLVANIATGQYEFTPATAQTVPR